MTDETRPTPARFVPRLAVVGEDAAVGDLLDEFPGRFTLEVCDTGEVLDSLLVAASVDLVLVDARRKLPASSVSDVLRREQMIDFLVVGTPPDRRTLPSWMRSHACPWPSERSGFYRLVMASSRKAQLERKLHRIESDNARLQTEARLGRALATALHEINNPLDAAQRFARLARQSTEEETTTKHIDSALLGLERIAEQVHAVQRDARRAATELREDELRDILREAVVISGVGSSLRLSMSLAEDLPRVPRALVGVLVNLLANARRASTDGGRVEIKAQRRGDHLEIDVTDDGEGFGDLFAEELFEPYFTTHAGRGGIGLGLPSSRVAVEQLGGSLTATSPGVDRGATFTICIPCPTEHRSEERT